MGAESAETEIEPTEFDDCLRGCGCVAILILILEEAMGGTVSTISLFNGKGEKLSEFTGAGTNYLSLGMDVVHDRINELVEEAKKLGNVPEDRTLTALGLSLSGCEDVEANKIFEMKLRKKYPLLSKEYYVCSDTVGPIAVAHRNGGAVIISGTGSNTLLVNPDGSEVRCGGWGGLLGDEGSAYWIAQKAIKICFDDLDRFKAPPMGYSSEYVWSAATSFFNAQTKFDFLSVFYENYNKARIASFCKVLSEGALKGDNLCKWLFKEAGHDLARAIQAIAEGASEDLLHLKGGLPVVCVGSVWKSWNLLKDGFVKQLEGNEDRFKIEELSLLKLTVSVSTGATYLAAKAINFNMPRDYTQNYEVFYHYKRSN